MDQTNTKEPRGPVSLRIKFRSASLDQFIERYAVDVSRGGIFIRTREPLAVGTQLKFDFQLQDAAPLLAGEGTVVWIREHDPTRTGVTPGMGVRFDKLTPASQPVLEKILTEKASREQAAGPKTGVGRRPSSTFSALDPSRARDAGAPGSGAAVAPAPSSEGAAAGRSTGSGLVPLPSAPSGPNSAHSPLTLPANRAPTPAPSPALGARPAPGAAGLPPRNPTPPPSSPLGRPRSPTLRPPPPSPSIAMPAVPRQAAPAGGASSDPLAPRPRANTTMGTGRPAPAPPSLFEPPTPADIDKALSSLTEAKPDAQAAAKAQAAVAAAAAAPAAPTTPVLDYPSNEPTRIAELPAEVLAGEKSAGAGPEHGGTHSLFKSPEIPTVAAELDPGDRTDLTRAPDDDVAADAPAPAAAAVLEVAPPASAASPSSAPAPQPVAPPLREPAPVAAARPAAQPQAQAPLPAVAPAKGSRAPLFIGAGVLVAAVVGFLVFVNRPKSPPAGEAETAPGAAAVTPPPVVAVPTPGAAAGTAPAGGATAAAIGADAAATAEALQATKAADNAAAVAAAAAAAATKPAEPTAAPDKAAADKAAAAAAKAAADERGPGRRRATARRKLAASKTGDTAPAGAAAADKTAPAADSAPAGDGKTEAPDKAEAAGSAPSQHVLRIVSTPPGAEVVVDGASAGKTPFLGNQIDPTAPHAITLKKDGFEAQEYMISTSDWSRPHNGVQTLKLTVKLRRAEGAEPAKASSAKSDKGGEAPEGAAAPVKKDDKKDDKKDEALPPSQ
jgi:uncharacterized protein (TIGR02266 family)